MSDRDRLVYFFDSETKEERHDLRVSWHRSLGIIQVWSDIDKLDLSAHHGADLMVDLDHITRVYQNHSQTGHLCLFVDPEADFGPLDTLPNRCSCMDGATCASLHCGRRLLLQLKSSSLAEKLVEEIHMGNQGLVCNHPAIMDDLFRMVKQSVIPALNVSEGQKRKANGQEKQEPMKRAKQAGKASLPKLVSLSSHNNTTSQAHSASLRLALSAQLRNASPAVPKPEASASAKNPVSNSPRSHRSPVVGKPEDSLRQANDEDRVEADKLRAELEQAREKMQQLTSDFEAADEETKPALQVGLVAQQTKIKELLMEDIALKSLLPDHCHLGGELQKYMYLEIAEAYKDATAALKAPS